MKNSIPAFSLISRTLLICLSTPLFSGCAQMSQYSIAEKETGLQTNISQFNKRFEGKMMDLGAAYLPAKKRRRFMEDSLKVKEKITFYDSSILETQLFEDELPVQMKANGPDFNKAVVTMRYQLAILPSNRLKTILVDQIWLWEKQAWRLHLDLEEFFK